MNDDDASRRPAAPAGKPGSGDTAQPREKRPGDEEHVRQSGNFGADEPDFGRPPGERPNPGQGGRPNPKGPEFEQGGRYPGKQPGNGNGDTGSSDPAHGRRERG